MPQSCLSEIENAVQQAAESGEILFVGLTAKAIASACGGSARQIAEELVQAGIRAGVTMQLSRPD